jgi:hypothetical protein
MKVGLFASTIGLILSIMLFIFLLYQILQINDDTLLVKQPLIIQLDAHKNIVSDTCHTYVNTYALEKADIDYYKAKHVDVQIEDANNPTLLEEVMHAIRDDNQSVHDTTVQNTTQALYKSLIKNDDVPEIEAPETILSFAKKSTMTPDDVEKVHFVLGEIRSRDAAVYNLDGQTETQVLDQVWTTGNDNVRRQLLNELIDCKVPDSNTIYCPTGVVTRIMNAVAIETPEKMSRTADTLRMEMMNTAIQLRDTLTTTDSYKALSDTEQTALFKCKLEDTYAEKYEGVISTDIVKKELASWIDYI